MKRYFFMLAFPACIMNCASPQEEAYEDMMEIRQERLEHIYNKVAHGMALSDVEFALLPDEPPKEKGRTIKEEAELVRLTLELAEMAEKAKEVEEEAKEAKEKEKYVYVCYYGKYKGMQVSVENKSLCQVGWSKEEMEFVKFKALHMNE